MGIYFRPRFRSGPVAQHNDVLQSVTVLVPPRPASVAADEQNTPREARDGRETQGRRSDRGGRGAGLGGRRHHAQAQNEPVERRDSHRGQHHRLRHIHIADGRAGKHRVGERVSHRMGLVRCLFHGTLLVQLQCNSMVSQTFFLPQATFDFKKFLKKHFFLKLVTFSFYKCRMDI